MIPIMTGFRMKKKVKWISAFLVTAVLAGSDVSAQLAPIFRKPDPAPTEEPEPAENAPLQPGISPGDMPSRTAPEESATPVGPPAPGSPEMAPAPPTEPPPVPSAEEPPPEPEPVVTPPSRLVRPRTMGSGFNSSPQTTEGARILELSIPAPRGQIVDRNGAPFAQNVVAYYLGVNFPYMEGSPDSEIVAYARERLSQANVAAGEDWTLEDEDIISHYKSRRWLPLIFSRRPLTDEQQQKIEELDLKGLILHPTYQRYYPQRKVASHIIGFVGKRGPWPKGEVPDGEEMWPTAQGVRGLELHYDEMLTGSPGRVHIIFNEKGERVEETVIRAPVPGSNVVLSLDLDMQKLAERLLSEHVHRGAFVMMDVQNGDVLAMASFPSFDPNSYIPRISQKQQDEFVNDPEKPLYGRAFQGVYPPASTFKVPVALGMLESGKINEYTSYDCPSSYWIGDRSFGNWNESGEGMMNVIGALKRSCNTWFYQAGIHVGVTDVTSMGVKLGYGQKTGVPIPEEAAGIMPTKAWYREKWGWDMGDGDLANLCIGQGSVESTPLQVAQAMAAIGNRQYLPKSRLVLQVQDYANNIIAATDYKETRQRLGVSQHSLAVVHRGMYEVVNAGGGTGRNASHKNISVSGKTGTGQWIPAKNQNVAWFSGFAPSEFPVYSFAALYEGNPGEKVGGGSKAAPIVGDFFEEYLTEEKLEELKATSDQIRITMGDVADEIEMETGSIFRNQPAQRPPPPPPAARRPKQEGGGFFRKLFGR